MSLQSLFKKLYEAGAIKIDTRPGHGFKMRIHDTQPDAPLSPIYINLRTSENPKPGPLTPELVAEIGRSIWDTLQETEIAFDGICGIPNAGLPLARALNAVGEEICGNRAPSLLLEKESRNGIPVFTGIADSDGLDAINLDENRQNVVLLIDDVITYAGTKEGACNALTAEGYEVKNVVVFCDREQGGALQLRRQDVIVISVCTISEIVRSLAEGAIIPEDDGQIVLDYIRNTST